MKIINVLKNIAQKDSIASKLLNLANDIKEQSNEHLKLIMSQLPEYDLHDDSHCKKVLENIENLIPEEKIQLLSKYELFLIYLSAYLHDCAMALPKWEFELLKLTEGTEKFFSNDINNPFTHDFKPPFKLSKAIEIIEERKKDLYENYNKVEDFIFIEETEEDLKKDLAKRLINYQEFRNGYIDKLKEIAREDDLEKYLKYSEFIRHEFIRSTHASRVGKYIRNLSPLFTERLGGSWGRALANDLALICKSHGEGFNYINEMNMQVNYFDSEVVNLQFVAIMLRLGDIIHFSYDRAPKSLLAEKMIRSEESLRHWKTKLQNLTYTMDDVDSDGKKVIKYMAYCEDPSSYYFIHEYMDWIDEEISNYYKFFHNVQYSINTGKYAEKYQMNIADEVDRSQIKYDEQKFKPANDLKFTLNQNKIIELLMGVGLYKNKYLCLREIYQNALDACRCMISSFSDNGMNIEGKIEFGLGEAIINGNKKKYLYCLDNGIGMTKRIIKEYLLNIGDSYYKSKDFYRRSTKWKDSFNPISEFGIGILSSFMIGNKIEITSKPVSDMEDNDGPLCFSIDGPHEYFYYMKPDSLDLEKIGDHGTLVKIFLNEDINNDFIEELPLIIFGQNNRKFKESRKDIFSKWDNNLYKLLLDSIGMVPSNINLKIKFANGNKKELINWNTLFSIDRSEFSEDDLKLLYYNYRYDGYKPYENYIKNRDFVQTQTMKITYKGIEYYFHLALPKKGIKCNDYRLLKIPTEINKQYKTVLIDGINVSEGNLLSNLEFDSRKDLIYNGILNFVGEERPKLSVDRNSITEIPQIVEERLKEIPLKICKKIAEEINLYFKKENIKINSSEAKMIWDYVFDKFSSLSSQIMKTFIEKDELDILVEDLSKLIGLDITLNEFVNLEKFTINNFNYNSFPPTIKLLVLGKTVDANKINVNENEVIIHSESFHSINYKDDIHSDLTPLIIKSNNWEGVYAEYDLVSSLWPIVPKKLFNSINCDYEMKKITKRTKEITSYSNSLAAIPKLDPVLINPKFGISTNNANKKGMRNLIGKSGKNIKNDFWMFEINNHGKTLEEGKDYFVYAFISPRELNEEEQRILEDYEEKDLVYYKGVLEGWSILFLGKTGEYIIEPGIVEKEKMIKKINSSFWEIHDDITYYFLDGTKVKNYF